MSDNLEERMKGILKSMGFESAYDPKGYLKSFYELQPKSDEKQSDKKAYSYDLTPEDGSGIVSIVPIYDVHSGHVKFNKEKFEQFVEYIYSTPNTYTILGGDLHESATATSVGKGLLDQEYHIGEQRRYLISALRPLAEEGKILSGITGNHEQRVANFNGDCPMKELCFHLGVPYDGYQSFLRIIVGDQKYDIMAFHGTGGGRSKGAKANAAMRPNEVAIADLYITGHTHDKTYLEDAIYYIDDNGDLRTRKRVYVVCGSFLGYFDSYPEMKGLPSSIIGSVRIDLMKDVKNIHVHY